MSINSAQSKTRLYTIWTCMKQRCLNPNAEGYKNYGGRGITVCPEWLYDFQAFEDWAYSHGYREYLTIDRIDNDKGYSPNNCRWATRLEQAHNRRPCVGKHRLYEINGIFKTSSEWATIAGISRKRFNKRWAAGKRGNALLAPSRFQDGGDTNGDGTENGGNNSRPGQHRSPRACFRACPE